ncbi:curli-like amyloid fiber formation chaperone CsgH [Nitratireductor sp. GCM10026969]|uniref:curli-like amyloid fiber formation chaperone CsgH n=1 Tax=Nitratireductor sp. GCM10026969 TaxID=3252645 RepID=UPI003623FB68
MLRNQHLFPAAVGLALALSATALMAGAGIAHSGPARCEVQTTTMSGMTTLEGVVHSDRSISGSYIFRVKSVGGSGSSNISQGGDFSATPGKPAKVGQVTLGGSGSIFEASLEVETPAGRLTCSKRTG